MLNVNSIMQRFGKSRANTEPTPSANFVIFRYECAGRKWKLAGRAVSGRLVNGNVVIDVTVDAEFCEMTRLWYPAQFSQRVRQIAVDSILEFV